MSVCFKKKIHPLKSGLLTFKYYYLPEIFIILFVPDLSRSRYLKSLQYPYLRQTSSEECKSAVFRCLQCSKVYNRKGNLGRHMRYECGKSPQFHCHLCEKSFFRREKLDYHIKNHTLDKVHVNQGGEPDCKMYQTYNFT